MKKSLILLFLSIILMEAKGQESQWFTPYSGSTKISNQQVAIDKQGNSYVVSSFEGDASIGDQEISSASHTCFITKVDPTGEKIIWMNQLETDGNSWGRKIAVDDNGNVAIVGDFRGSVGVGSTKVSTTGEDRDWFVAYFSSEGQLQWIKSGGGDNPGFEIGIGVGFDKDGNVYALGNACGAEGAIDNAVFFAPTRTSNTDGKANFDGKAIDGVVATFYTAMLVKVSPAGEVAWVNTAIDTSAGGMDVDADGNVYVNAVFGNYASIFDETFSSGGINTVAIVKIDNAGNKSWIKTFGPEGKGTPGKASKNTTLAMAQGIKVSDSGYIIVHGSATGPVYDGGDQISSKIKAPVNWLMGMKSDGTRTWFGEVEGLLLGGFDADSDNNTYVSAWGLKGSLMGESVKTPSVFKISEGGDVLWQYEGKIVDKKKKYSMIGYSSIALNPSDNSLVLAGTGSFQDISIWEGMNKTVTTRKTYTYLTLNLIK